jgi:hypothetical protein
MHMELFFGNLSHARATWLGCLLAQGRPLKSFFCGTELRCYAYKKCAIMINEMVPSDTVIFNIYIIYILLDMVFWLIGLYVFYGFIYKAGRKRVSRDLDTPTIKNVSKMSKNSIKMCRCTSVHSMFTRFEEKRYFPWSM